MILDFFWWGFNQKGINKTDDEISIFKKLTSWGVLIAIILKLLLCFFICQMNKYKKKSSHFMILDQVITRKNVEDLDYLVSDYE